MCTHFHIEDGSKYKQHFGILCFVLFQERKNTEAQKKICAVYGEGAVTDQMCQKWFAKFCAGDFLLDDASQLGRAFDCYQLLVEVNSNQIETLIENNQH